jgi:hypothetical protein
MTAPTPERADGNGPTPTVRAARSTLAPGSAGRAAPVRSPVAGAAHLSSPQPGERQAAGIPGPETAPPPPLGKAAVRARVEAPAPVSRAAHLDRAAAMARVPDKMPAGSELASPREANGALSAGQMAIARAMSEAGLEEQVQELCEGFGILRFHNPDSRRVREKGLPDDILIGARGVLWRELKNMKRKLTPEQEKVGEQLAEHGQDWSVWRPPDLLSRRIEHELRAISGLRIAGGTA